MQNSSLKCRWLQIVKITFNLSLSPIIRLRLGLEPSMYHNSLAFMSHFPSKYDSIIKFFCDALKNSVKWDSAPCNVCWSMLQVQVLQCGLVFPAYCKGNSWKRQDGCHQEVSKNTNTDNDRFYSELSESPLAVSLCRNNQQPKIQNKWFSSGEK